MTVKLDGDVIMGEIVNDKRYHSQGLGSVEDLRSVCSCTWVTCHPNFFSRDAQGRRKGSISPHAQYSDYYQTPPRSRPESVHEIRSCEYSNSDYGLLRTPLQAPQIYPKWPQYPGPVSTSSRIGGRRLWWGAILATTLERRLVLLHLIN